MSAARSEKGCSLISEFEETPRSLDTPGSARAVWHAMRSRLTLRVPGAWAFVVASGAASGAASALHLDPRLGPPDLVDPSSCSQGRRLFLADLGDTRQIALFAHLLAHAWADAREQGNHQLEYWAAKGLLMCEQMGNDSGRTTMAWLFTGLPDPQWSLLQKRRQGLKPYAKLAQGSWVAANTAYLRDLDYLEGPCASRRTLASRMTAGSPCRSPARSLRRSGWLW